MEITQRKRGRPSKKETQSPIKDDLHDLPVSKKYQSRQISHDLIFKIFILFMTFLGLVVRAFMIHHPGQVVFDEVHFGKFASYYLRGEYFFDVHPPLGKLLIAFVAWLVGYDGHFLFDNIGDDYAENNVPYVALRLWCALCGALAVPFGMLILKEVGVSLLGCILGGIFLVFDTALTTQSRLILLDSMLMLFCTMSIYFWIKFQSHRHQPFSMKWWFWLSMTGVGLALVTGVKMVGLFTVATIGIATLFDLWDLLDIKKGHSMKYFGKHFGARALCLILLPFILYLVPFYIHFRMLPMSGPGDNFMSLQFQAQLDGNTKTAGSTSYSSRLILVIPFESHVTFQHLSTNHFLHSHPHVYPLRYEDGRVSSQGQQVNAYAHSDNNSFWQILAVDHAKIDDHRELDDDEKEKNVRYVRGHDYVRLKHSGTGKYLITHDVASPLTKTNMEMTCVSEEVADQRYNETVWRVTIFDGEAGHRIKSKKDVVFLVNLKHAVALHTFKQSLPDWGFKMQETNGNKKTTEHSNRWSFQQVKHETIAVTNTTKDDSDKPKLSFLRKFVELQALMIHHNNQLTKSHPYSSAPITWPFVVRGISFWETKDGLKQIYLLGNPFAWWISIMGPLLYAVMWVFDRILLRRGIDDLGATVRGWWDKAIGFLLLAWLMHWLPFFLMGRMLFLHHYMPAYIFSVVSTITLIDFVFRDFTRHLYKIHKVPMKEWRGPVTKYYYGFALVSASLVIFGFYYFSPLCYGLGFKDLETLRAHKWFPTWDLQYA